ncbi:MAG: class I SAM-dependent methyltransferase [Oscillospiraceae bacterium]|nr:class I SAM-dependent methyltransferase [Oscillospiraceae bacterium]
MYEILARYYDGLMSHVDYKAWADYMIMLAGPGKHRVLELGCGTGNFTRFLCERGLDAVAADSSPSMLSVAQGKGIDALFIQQDMRELDLYGTVDAVFCALDGMNHLLTPEDFCLALSKIHLFLEPGGAFVFDMLTSYDLSRKHQCTFSSESSDALCIWRSEWEKPFCRSEVTLFALRENGCYARYNGEITERSYTRAQIEGFLSRAGFVDIKAYGMFTTEKPGRTRVAYTARKI